MEVKFYSFWRRYREMMEGQIVDFSEGEVAKLLAYLDYYQINTLMIQSNPEKTNNITKWFTCKVDEQTVKAYIKEKNSEMRIV